MKFFRRSGSYIALAAVIFLVALPGVFMNSVYGYLPVLFLLFLLAGSLLCMLLVRRSMGAEADFNRSSCERGKSVTIGLQITNEGRIMCPKAVVNLFISDLFGGTDHVTQTWMTLAPKSSNQIGLDMDMPHIGVYQVGVKDMDIYDLTGVFRSHVPMDGTFQVFVKPRIFPVDELLQNENAFEDSPRDTSSSVLSGMDYVGVREYEYGDSMKSVHWKLSSRGMGYMTKMHESSKEMSFSVILDTSADRQSDREVAMDLYDRLVETALSLITEIAKRHTSYRLIYCDKEGNVKQTTPKGRHDDESLIQSLSVLTQDPEAKYPDGAKILADGRSKSNRSSNVIVCTCRVTEELLQGLLGVKRERKVPELYVIVPIGMTSRELELLKGRLSILDEANIYYKLVYTTDGGGAVS